MKITKIIPLFMLTCLSPMLCSASEKSSGFFSSWGMWHWLITLVGLGVIGYLIYNYMIKK